MLVNALEQFPSFIDFLSHSRDNDNLKQSHFQPKIADDVSVPFLSLLPLPVIIVCVKFTPLQLHFTLFQSKPSQSGGGWCTVRTTYLSFKDTWTVTTPYDGLYVLQDRRRLQGGGIGLYFKVIFYPFLQEGEGEKGGGSVGGRGNKTQGEVFMSFVLPRYWSDPIPGSAPECQGLVGGDLRRRRDQRLRLL
jgi:hypothetical protein